MARARLLLLALLLTAPACGGDDVDPGTDAGTDRDDAGGDHDDAGGDDVDGGGDPGDDAGEEPGDGNDTMSSADPLEFDVEGMLNDGGEDDVDWYSIEVEAGEFVAVVTAAPATEASVDTVITLFDGAGTQVAENDDAEPRVDTRSGLVHRATSAGPYYARVQSWNNWMTGGTPGVYDDFAYHVYVGTFPAVDEGDNDTAATAQDIWTDPTEPVVITGTQSGAADVVDVYAFDAEHGSSVRATMHAGGTTGNGSTGRPPTMWITDAAGGTTALRVGTDGSNQLWAPLSAGRYLLWVDAPTAAGANDFYAITLETGLAEYESELNEADNDTVAGAAALPGAGGVLGQMSDVDVDHFSVIAAGTSLSVRCHSSRIGSGVVGLHAELLTAAGDPVAGATGTESATDDVFFGPITVTSGASYVLRVDADSMLPDVASRAYRCVITVE